MNINYLLPHKFKRIGWIILVPSAILGILYLFESFEPDFLDWTIFAIITDIAETRPLFSEEFFVFHKDNVTNELIACSIIVGSLMVAFSRERVEDEFIRSIRLESLVWATVLNYALLLMAVFFVYGFVFANVMIVNMFTILILFIARFHWVLHRSRKAAEV